MRHPLFEIRYGFSYGPEGSRRGECHGRHGGRPSWRDLLRQVRGYSPFLTMAQSTESRSAFRQFLCDGVALKGSMVISTVQAWGIFYSSLKQRVVLCKIKLYETYLF